jgi:Transcription factor involved in chromatin remodeling, contains bromodomain
LNLIDYPILIKHPMDLGTIKKKLKTNKYKNITDFLDDIQLVWNNCKLYNQEGSVFIFIISLRPSLSINKP